MTGRTKKANVMMNTITQLAVKCTLIKLLDVSLILKNTTQAHANESNPPVVLGNIWNIRTVID